MCDYRTQHLQKLNVLAGFCKQGITRPFFINRNLNAAIFGFTENEVILVIENMFNENTQNI